MPVTLLSSSTPTCSSGKQVIFFRTDIYPFITLKINKMSTTTSQATKVLYTAQTHTIGNRENSVSRSSDGNLEVRLAEVDLALDGSAFFLQARLNIHLPGLDRTVAHSLVEAARNICPYSKAIHGNVNVEYNLI